MSSSVTETPVNLPRRIIQIVPYLPPAISGVGDYAYVLARELRAAHHIETHFVLCDSTGRREVELDRFNVDQLETRKDDVLERHIGGLGMPSIIILHYVGYGYEKRGCPVWLLKGLERWKERDASRKLIVMFHELYASGPPWRSSFWTSPLQRTLVKSLALLSDHCVTNQQMYMQLLVRMISRLKSGVTVLPVFSTVGEPTSPSRVGCRKPRMIVFGGAGWRRQAYDGHWGAIEQACQSLGVKEVVDIGPSCGSSPSLSVPCTIKDSLPAAEVSQELLDARAGFFTYPSAYLGKSTIFAAYAAHGLLPVTYAENIAENKDGLRPGEHFLPVSPSYHWNTDIIETTARHAQDWYTAHKISVQAARYRRILQLSTSGMDNGDQYTLARS